MKYSFLIISIIVLAILVSSGSIFYFDKSNNVIGKGNDQQVIVDNLVATLKMQSIPVKSIQLNNDNRWNPPVLVDCVLQSSSDDKGIPDDAIYVNLTKHAINLSQQKGLNFGAINYTYLNNQNLILAQELKNPKKDITSQFNPPHTMDNTNVSNLLRQNWTYPGISIQNIGTSLDEDGLRHVTLSLSVPDIATANTNNAKLMGGINAIISELNQKQGAKIAIYQIRLNYTNGIPLLRYINDLQQREQTWWQADELAQEWFPHPAQAETNKTN